MTHSPSAATGALRTDPAPWRRFVALGDSFTEGIGDPDPDDETGERHIGWADRLAALLAGHADDFHYANLAVRGRKINDIAGAQVDTALELGPDLVSIVGGGNDILRARVDVDGVAAQLDEAVARLRSAGADVLLATPTDPAEAPIIGMVRGRAAILTAHVLTIAQRHGCYLVNQWGCAFLKDWRMWDHDRIHLSAEGHRRIALEAYTSLGHDQGEADWRIPLPPQPQPGRLDQWREDASWAKNYAVPWVQRRLQGKSSGDAVSAKRPDLAPWHQDGHADGQPE